MEEKVQGPRAHSAAFTILLLWCVLPASPPGTTINIITKKKKTRTNKGIIEMGIVSKTQSKRKPQLVFWRQQQQLPVCLCQASIVNLAPCPTAGPCGLATLQPAHTSSPPPLALGALPGPPQAANHVARLREQSGRTLEQLG